VTRECCLNRLCHSYAGAVVFSGFQTGIGSTILEIGNVVSSLHLGAVAVQEHAAILSHTGGEHGVSPCCEKGYLQGTLVCDEK